MQGDRIILHCDCNSFFASVEEARDPRLKNVPMAVAGSRENRHGIILAKNQLAKGYGVETAETVWSAQKKCKDLVLVEPHHEEYARYSRATDEIFRRYTDLVERFGIDEAWLDVTGSTKLFGTGVEIADRIRKEVKTELGITVSVGVSFNKAFAKLGSDYKKPDAVTVISRENYREIAYPLPVENLLFVGKRTAEELKRFNIYTIGDVASSSRAFLEERLGKAGATVYDYAIGEDLSPVTSIFAEETPMKSVGNGMTFRRDLVTKDEIITALQELSNIVAARMRKRKMLAGIITVTVKGIDLRTSSRQRSIDTPIAIGREIADMAFRLLNEIWHIGKPIRALTVTASGIVPESMATTQLSFFESGQKKHEKLEKIESAMDKIRERFGHDSLVSGAVLHNDFGLSSEKNEDP